ncbi:molecular chaperone [Escherichia coli]|nr:molecular chaperone [Escherichia coli]
MLVSFYSVAGVMTEHSRFIFNGDKDFESSVLVNTNEYPVVVQLWIDQGDYTQAPEKSDAPFFITPVTSKMEPLKINEIKIIYSGESVNLPQDRESLYWVNIFEVPPFDNKTSAENKVALTMLTQVKLIYRPVKLKTDASKLRKVLTKISFKPRAIQNKISLILNNPTPYMANMASLTLVSRSGENLSTVEAIQGDNLTIYPMSSKEIALDNFIDINSIYGLILHLIDDQGRVYMQKIIK